MSAARRVRLRMLLARRTALAASATLASFTTARARMAPVAPLPLTSSLANAPLKPLLASSAGDAITAGSLWRDAPAVIVAVRRPGCQLCRAEVFELHRIKPALDKAGVRLVAVLHEALPEQVAEFKADFWPGELYLDETKAVFKAVGGGSIRRGSLLAFLNPFSRIWCAATRRKGHSPVCRAHTASRRTHVKDSDRTVEKSNLIGDGLTFGGLLVVRKDGKVQYAFQEATFGDHAPPDDVLDAALKAAEAR
jgi:hypothetical protein